MKELKVPLANAIAEKDTLQKQVASFEKDSMALKNALARLQDLKDSEKENKTNKEEIMKKLDIELKNKKDMYEKFE